MGEDIITTGLRILAADEDEQTLRATDTLLSGLGHRVAGHVVNVSKVGDLIANEDPDLSIVFEPQILLPLIGLALLSLLPVVWRRFRKAP